MLPHLQRRQSGVSLAVGVQLEGTENLRNVKDRVDMEMGWNLEFDGCWTDDLSNWGRDRGTRERVFWGDV